jgi:SAM-dependent methyltransferase
MNACQEVQGRGDRLYPSRGSRTYWVLTELRRAYEKMAVWSSRMGVKAVIDYGCGNMPYRPLFEKQGIRYLGYDLPTNDLANGFLTTDGRLPLENDTFQLVLSSQVLEHVPDPILYLSEARRVLHDGGWLALSTHGIWKYHPDPHDLWRWTSDGLQQLIIKSGFAIENFTGLVGLPAAGVQLLQDGLYPRVPRPLKTPFVRLCQLIMQLLDRRWPTEAKNKDACVYLVLAVKQDQR